MALNIKKAKKEYQNTFRPLFFSFELVSSSSKIKSGTNAKNNIGKKPIPGQENANRHPLNTAATNFFILVTNIIIFLLI